MAKQLKKNDTVVVIAGAEKGKRGRVLHVQRAKNRIVIEGVNTRKKAIRRTPDKPQGGIENIECPIHISNVMLEAAYDARRPAGAKADDKAKAPAAAAATGSAAS
jgi:large subunit ribosomal protein L24